MKKRVIGITLILLISITLISFANSGPVYWQGYPSSGIMAIDENSPIVVNREDLVFDFSDYKGNSHTISGKVTATYEMANTTSKPQSVQMAFPIIGALFNFQWDDIAITVDNEILPYDVYFGDVVNSYGNPYKESRDARFEFSDIVKTITTEPYIPINFVDNQRGKLYTIEVRPLMDERINFVLDFSFNSEKTKILTKGFNGYRRNNEKVRLSSWCYKPETLEIFVLGEDIELNISAYSDGELKKKSNQFTYHTLVEGLEIKSYLTDYIKSNALFFEQEVSQSSTSMNYDDQLYKLYAKSLDTYFTRNLGYSSEHDLMAEHHYERFITLVYTVDFIQNSQREVMVSYNTSGTMDKTKTTKPLYSYEYILNPAENWMDFSNLNIKVITPKQAPYIVKSNIEFAKNNDNVYTADLEKLPNHDLTFTLYGDEEIAWVDRVHGSFQRRFGYLTPLVIGGAVLLTILVAVKFVVGKRVGI